MRISTASNSNSVLNTAVRLLRDHYRNTPGVAFSCTDGLMHVDVNADYPGTANYVNAFAMGVLTAVTALSDEREDGKSEH